TEEARPVARHEDLRGPGRIARDHAGHRRFGQRRHGGARGRLPRAAHDLRLQPRAAGARSARGRLHRLAGGRGPVPRCAQLASARDQDALPSKASLSFQSAGEGPSQMRIRATKNSGSLKGSPCGTPLTLMMAPVPGTQSMVKLSPGFSFLWSVKIWLMRT